MFGLFFADLEEFSVDVDFEGDAWRSEAASQRDLAQVFLYYDLEFWANHRRPGRDTPLKCQV